MPTICYTPRRFKPAVKLVVEQALEIIAEYEEQGFDLTLRQLYYQFVSRDLIPNNQAEYKKLGSVISDARMAGLIDWDTIVDRTRNLQQNAHWESPAEVLEYWSKQYLESLWLDQPNYVEVWVEKDALIGVLETVCRPLDVPFFSCRGYTSMSELWSAAMRLLQHSKRGQRITIFHLGDHDPSGIDMSRDIQDRLNTFMLHHGNRTAEVHRIALNWDQVKQYSPPPNPAKITDSRARKYIEEYGTESWELDALSPTVIGDLITGNVKSKIVASVWNASLAKQNDGRTRLAELAEQA